nr:MAG TPA: hypothetical protein [Caudoviricetes sp.]
MRDILTTGTLRTTNYLVNRILTGVGGSECLTLF